MQPGCSLGPSGGHEAGDAAEGGFGGGAEMGAEVGVVGAGAEAVVLAAAGSYRMTAHCERASVCTSPLLPLEETLPLSP